MQAAVDPLVTEAGDLDGLISLSFFMFFFFFFFMYNYIISSTWPLFYIKASSIQKHLTPSSLAFAGIYV
jgi:hypothetical protein